MAGVATTKLSSKGQVVILENIRKKLRLEAGVQFVVLGDKDVVILKKISPPSIDEFDTLIKKLERRPRRWGLKSQILKQ